MDLTAIALALIAKFDVLTTVLVMCMGACSWYHVIWRREDREDRAKLLELFSKQIEATNGLKNVLSALTGKQLQ